MLSERGSGTCSTLLDLGQPQIAEAEQPPRELTFEEEVHSHHPHGGLSLEEIDQFVDNGYIILRNVFDEDLATGMTDSNAKS